MSMPEAKTVSEALIASLETVAVMAVGNYEEVRFTPDERLTIAEPLARTIQRMSPAAIGRYQALTDPITVLAIVGMWGARCYQVYQIQQEQRKEAVNGQRASYANGFNRDANGNIRDYNGARSGSFVASEPVSGVNGNRADSGSTDDGITGNTGGIPGFGRQSY